MFSAALEALKTETNNLQRYLEATHSVRDILGRIEPSLEPSHLEHDLAILGKIAPDVTRWRVMEHSLIVGRLYAFYESFCENLLSDWIYFLTNNLRFDQLPKKIIESYPAGFASIVSTLPSSRYPRLTTKELVASYHAALQGQGEYALNAECLIYHKNNLRWPELCAVFSRCGVDGLHEWISESVALSERLQMSSERIADVVAARLSNFIQYRNDSSHGAISPDEILGYEELYELTEFVGDFAENLDQFIKWKMVGMLCRSGRAQAIGRVTEVFRKANAVICVTNEARVKEGQKIYIKKGSEFREDRILTIQLDGDGLNVIDAEAGTELGIMLSRVPRKGSELYYVRE